MPEQDINLQLEALSQELFGLSANRWGFTEDVGYYNLRKKTLLNILEFRKATKQLQSATSTEDLKPIIIKILDNLFSETKQNLEISIRLAETIKTQNITSRVLKEMKQLDQAEADIIT